MLTETATTKHSAISPPIEPHSEIRKAGYIIKEMLRNSKQKDCNFTASEVRDILMQANDSIDLEISEITKILNELFWSGVIAQVTIIEDDEHIDRWHIPSYYINPKSLLSLPNEGL